MKKNLKEKNKIRIRENSYLKIKYYIYYYNFYKNSNKKIKKIEEISLKELKEIFKDLDYEFR